MEGENTYGLDSKKGKAPMMVSIKMGRDMEEVPTHFLKMEG